MCLCSGECCAHGIHGFKFIYFYSENLPLECKHLTYINNFSEMLKPEQTSTCILLWAGKTLYLLAFRFFLLWIRTAKPYEPIAISPFIVVTSIDPLTNQYNKNKTGSKHFFSLILKMTRFSFPSNVGMHPRYPSSLRTQIFYFSSFVVGLNFLHYRFLAFSIFFLHKG